MKYLLFGIIAFLLGVLTTVLSAHLRNKDSEKKE